MEKIGRAGPGGCTQMYAKCDFAWSGFSDAGDFSFSMTFTAIDYMLSLCQPEKHSRETQLTIFSYMEASFEHSCLSPIIAFDSGQWRQNLFAGTRLLSVRATEGQPEFYPAQTTKEEWLKVDEKVNVSLLCETNEMWCIWV